MAETGFLGGILQASIGTASGTVVIPLPAGSTGGFGNGEARNNLGQFAGYYTVFNPQVFFGTTAATTFVPPAAAAGFVGLTMAGRELGLAINDSGQIVATGAFFFFLFSFLLSSCGHWDNCGKYRYSCSLGRNYCFGDLRIA